MRRSLAPSQSLEAKRGRFVPSFKKTSANVVQVGSPSAISNRNSLASNQSGSSKRSPLDIIKLVENIETVYNSTDETQGKDQISDENVINKFEVNKTEEKLAESNNENKDGEKYFKVLWCKRSTRKHKKWEGDAIIEVKKRSVIMKDMNNKIIGSAMGYKQSELEILDEGSQLVVGGKEIEIMEKISNKDYGSGVCFHEDIVAQQVLSNTPLPSVTEFKKPFQNPCRLIETRIPMRATPKYDPSKLGAIVMPRPNATEQLHNSEIEQQFIDVVIDPALAKKLREHQKEGVIFLYECLTKIRQFNGQGAILADEMGLGKTLQCVTILWTMLKQGPFGGKPLIKRALIITPSSLMKNWLNEFNLWLGKERLRICLANQSDKIELYCKAQVEPVMITSYELAVKHHEILEKIKFDIMICDEGHRLKNASTKTASLLGQLPIKKRIALTGTPIQNDLQEFFSLVDFCNPGILGSIACFKKVYEEPIIKSKQPSASKTEISLGEMRSAELCRLTSQFILRRTQDVNNKYLPAKVEYVVFCKPSQLQLELYSAVLSSRCIKSCLAGNNKDGSFHLVCISCLKKLSSHPSLIFQTAKDASELPPELAENSPYAKLFSYFPKDFEKYKVPPRELSGKLNSLAIILNQIKLLVPRERVVLVSNSTKALDMIESLCKIDKHTTLRLDGSTPLKNRQDLVDRFNASYSDTYVFLLSSKAGGVGLNLIGASRLILFDIDWNPANDLQAMSRVWRDGQSKRVHIYRLLTTGTIEEKIYQRQITKHNLTTILAKGAHKKMQFSIDDLKDLFSLDKESMCTTHDLMGCDCTSLNTVSANVSTEVQSNRAAQLTIEKTWNKSKNLTIDEFMSWKHMSGQLLDNNIEDSCLEPANETITFVFSNFVNEEASKN